MARVGTGSFCLLVLITASQCQGTAASFRGIPLSYRCYVDASLAPNLPASGRRCAALWLTPKSQQAGEGSDCGDIC